VEVTAIKKDEEGKGGWIMMKHLYARRGSSTLRRSREEFFLNM